MSAVIYWFRQDLRLADNLALIEACNHRAVLPVYCLDPIQRQVGRWGITPAGPHRHAWLKVHFLKLKAALQANGSDLLIIEGRPKEVLPELARLIDADAVICEDIHTPEEIAEVDALQKNGLQVQAVWQSSLLHPDQLPFPVAEMPSVFTRFRQAVELSKLEPSLPAGIPTIPSLPIHKQLAKSCDLDTLEVLLPTPLAVSDSSFPYTQNVFQGGEIAAHAHLETYFSGTLAQHYKATRNALSGTDFSTKFSPWLAVGALSPRQIFAALSRHEAIYGKSSGSDWIRFELLWRDYFRFLHLQHGLKLYGPNGLGLSKHPSVQTTVSSTAWQAWASAKTGEPLVDAGMRELQKTGYLSNRMRQIVASYLIYQMAGDWRQGAAWFEHCLIDYDVYSNQGNWLYIAGRGTDPRGGRCFSIAHQTHEYDTDGQYRARWSE